MSTYFLTGGIASENTGPPEFVESGQTELLDALQALYSF